MTQKKDQPTYLLTKRVEISLVLSADHPLQALATDDLLEIQITGKQNKPLQVQNASIRSICLLTINNGVMVGLVPSPGEKRVEASALTIARWQLEGTTAFGRWLENYRVDACSGAFSLEQIAQYGFPLPDRPADAVWYLPDAHTSQHAPYPIDSIQWEWWQGDEHVLGIQQANDSVTGDTHFVWYRIPISMIALRLREDESFAQRTLSEVCVWPKRE